jgi:hypothetical protein
MKDQLASEAFDLFSECEPTGAYALIAPDAEWAREPANINSDSSIRDRPDPSRQVRHDKDTQRESDNKDIFDKEHAAYKRAHATLKSLSSPPSAPTSARLSPPRTGRASSGTAPRCS